MDPIAIREKQKYETIWGSFPEYRKESPADYLTVEFLRYFQKQIKPGDSVIDFGCGPGRSTPHLLLAKLHVHLIDLCKNCLDPEIDLLVQESKIQFTQGCLWDLPNALMPAEWLICFDVLEHLPPEKMTLAFSQMALRMKKGGLLSIALCEDGFGKAINEVLHLTIKNTTWWKRQIQRFFLLEQSFCLSDKWLIAFIKKK
jgi:SAM-dependent methyltransferase